VIGDPEVTHEVPVDTIDAIAGRVGTPDLLKLDLQGAEFDALRGALKSLAHVEMVIVEFGITSAYIGRTTPRELIDLLYDAGFRLYDVAGLSYRPHDKALGGGDLFFVHSKSPLVAYAAWA
jgi:hypothetical protein